MKTITLLFAVCLMIAVSLPAAAQTDCIREKESGAPDPACCNDIICTDPTNNNAENNERSGMTNQFNWMSSTWNVFHPLPGGGYTTQNGTAPYPMQNPFKSDYPYLMHLNYSNVPITQRDESILDFHPADGWELLYKNNGLKPDEQTYLPVEDRRSGPYYILYNRYIYMIEIEKKNKQPQQRVIELERK